MDVRPGDSTTDRLSRARTLLNLSTNDPVGRLTVARAALANTDYAAARAAMEPLVGEGKRPTVKMCLLMAELEEAEHGDNGLWREWLARASRAALDPAWMSDGIVYDEWAPASPTTGRLDAFRWQVPAERPGPVMDALPPRPQPALQMAEPAGRCFRQPMRRRRRQRLRPARRRRPSSPTSPRRSSRRRRLRRKRSPSPNPLRLPPAPPCTTARTSRTRRRRMPGRRPSWQRRRSLRKTCSSRQRRSRSHSPSRGAPARRPPSLYHSG